MYVAIILYFQVHVFIHMNSRLRFRGKICMINHLYLKFIHKYNEIEIKS